MTAVEVPATESTETVAEHISLSGEVTQVRQRLGLGEGDEHIFTVDHHTPGWESFSFIQHEGTTILVMYTQPLPIGVSLAGTEYKMRRRQMYVSSCEGDEWIQTTDVFTHGDEINIGHNDTITELSTEQNPEDITLIEPLLSCFRQIVQCVRSEDLIDAHPALQIPNRQF